MPSQNWRRLASRILAHRLYTLKRSNYSIHISLIPKPLWHCPPRWHLCPRILEPYEQTNSGTIRGLIIRAAQQAIRICQRESLYTECARVSVYLWVSVCLLLWGRRPKATFGFRLRLGLRIRLELLCLGLGLGLGFVFGLCRNTYLQPWGHYFEQFSCSECPGNAFGPLLPTHPWSFALRDAKTTPSNYCR